MRKFCAYGLLLVGLFAEPNRLQAQEEIVIEQPYCGVPVQTAIYRRRYGAVETEDEVALQELEVGRGTTDTFKFVAWRRYYRPYGGWYGFYGPRYYVGYPGFYGYYPSYAPYWGGFYGGFYGGMPYARYYAPPVYYSGYRGLYGGYVGYGGYRGFRGYGGCYYW
jgi:hypothetical protein